MKKSVMICLVLATILSADCKFGPNGTTICEDTGLVWQDTAKVGRLKLSWEDAIKYCEGLKDFNGGGWRLPNMRELQTIGRHYSSKGFKHMRKIIGSSEFFWSSTSYAKKPTKAWGVEFTSSYAGYHTRPKTYDQYVRCVKDL